MILLGSCTRLYSKVPVVGSASINCSLLTLFSALKKLLVPHDMVFGPGSYAEQPRTLELVPRTGCEITSARMQGPATMPALPRVVSVPQVASQVSGRARKAYHAVRPAPQIGSSV